MQDLSNFKFFRFPRREISRVTLGLSQRRAEVLQSRLAAQFGVDGIMIDHVVAMRAAAPRLEKRRHIEVADPERFEIANAIGSL